MSAQETKTSSFLNSWRISKRNSTLNKGISFTLMLSGFALALLISALLLETQGKSGLKGVFILLEGGFGNPLEIYIESRNSGEGILASLWNGFFMDNYALVDTVLQSIPIFLCSLGVASCFHLQVWNIGAEGQFALGAVGATAAVLAFPNLPSYIILPLMFLTASLAGALWAVIPALLRQYLKTNEIISTLMLNYIGILFLQYLVYGPWKDPAGMGFPMTKEFPTAAIIPILFNRIHWGVVLCILAASLLYVFLNKTRYGYEILAGGANDVAARYSGIRYSGIVILTMAICGALAAWAGCLEVSATLERLRPNAVVGYGYTAIVVAWLARLKISRILLLSLILAGLRVGSGVLQLDMGVSAAFGGLIQGLILLCVLAFQFPENYTLKRILSSKSKFSREKDVTE